jgi:hypothetical protein
VGRGPAKPGQAMNPRALGRLCIAVMAGSVLGIVILWWITR